VIHEPCVDDAGAADGAAAVVVAYTAIVGL